MIRDPRDRMLPPEMGQYLLEDPFSGEKLYIDTKQYGSVYKKFVEEEEANIERHFKSTKSDLLKLDTSKDFYKEIMTFFKKRALTHRN